MQGIPSGCPDQGIILRFGKGLGEANVVLVSSQLPRNATIDHFARVVPSMRVIDFHTHAFPDRLVNKAIPALEKTSGVKAVGDGTLSGLLSAMDQYSIEKSVVLSVATKEEQFEPILNWSRSVQSNRIIPFASIHPDTLDPAECVRKIAECGIKGVKLHPLYQRFAADDKRVFPLYEAIRDTGLILLTHCGYDISFGTQDLASPSRFASVARQFPGLKMVLAHFGGWKQTDLFVECLAGQDVYIDTAFTVGYCKEAQRDAILSHHSTDRILYGSDFPWGDLDRQIGFVLEMPVSDEVKEKILYRNAERLLSS